MNLNLKLVKAVDAHRLINYRVVSVRGIPEFTLDAHLRFLNVAPSQMAETKAKLKTGELLLMEQMQAQVRETPSSGYASGSSPAMGSTSSQAEPPVVARPGDVTADRAARLDALLESPDRATVVPKKIIEINDIDYPTSIQTRPVAAPSRPYSHLPDHPSVGPKKDFTRTQKKKFLAENRKSNAGALRDDVTGEELVQPQQHQKGLRPPDNEAHVDHIHPRSQGGANSSSNAHVRSRKNNLEKSDN